MVSEECWPFWTQTSHAQMYEKLKLLKYDSETIPLMVSNLLYVEEGWELITGLEQGA